jgi:hypothetical protein
MYIGTTTGTILVMQIEIRKIILHSILFDQYGYMASSCNYTMNNLYLLTQDGNYTGISLSTPTFPRYIGFDIKGRFVLISFHQISVYN